MWICVNAFTPPLSSAYSSPNEIVTTTNSTATSRSPQLASRSCTEQFNSALHMNHFPTIFLHCRLACSANTSYIRNAFTRFQTRARASRGGDEAHSPRNMRQSMGVQAMMSLLHPINAKADRTPMRSRGSAKIKRTQKKSVSGKIFSPYPAMLRCYSELYM